MLSQACALPGPVGGRYTASSPESGPGVRSRMRALARRELRAPQAAPPEAARRAERRPVKCWELKQRTAVRESQRRSICWE
ncbi:unnamed protein product [Rangifer tarandus platyrhynchus]|uniref:Uncharacterized protein n=1 Tax=Rangifer tarandus platyrhynchus TaxID=3082113 RepID=A0ABN8XWM6_RANTA|nr:unnamed protein product [Rangifer tarandus platyrhynchus]